MAIHKMKNMWRYIDEILVQFRSCFSRAATHKWFMIVIAGLMTRSDHLGVSSIIRELMLDPNKYNCLIHFFRSEAWSLESIQQKWLEIVKATGAIRDIFGKPILIGDGVKQAKEANRMPGVKKLHQESENSTKSEYIRGILFGGLGILVGGTKKLFSLPLSMNIHDGNDAILKWIDSEYKDDSHVTRLIREACKAALALGKSCWLLMDAYFLTGPALKAITEESVKAGKELAILITRAKSNYTAWWKPDGEARKPRPRDSFKIMGLFLTKAECFIEETLTVYGEAKQVSYMCVNLLWGRDLFQEIRFVLVNLDDSQIILACTGLDIDPRRIIELYCYRFKIETLFRAFKQTLGGFACRFWTRRMPAFKLFAKAVEMEARVEAVTADISRESIINTYDAIEGFVMFACIAMGLIQLCALKFSNVINKNENRWLRTSSSSIPSEETTALTLRYFLRTLNSDKSDDLALVKAIRERQPISVEETDNDCNTVKSA